jgi:hypothetical protein
MPPALGSSKGGKHPVCPGPLRYRVSSLSGWDGTGDSFIIQRPSPRTFQTYSQIVREPCRLFLSARDFPWLHCRGLRFCGTAAAKMPEQQETSPAGLQVGSRDRSVGWYDPPLTSVEEPVLLEKYSGTPPDEVLPRIIETVSTFFLASPEPASALCD